MDIVDSISHNNHNMKLDFDLNDKNKLSSFIKELEETLAVAKFAFSRTTGSGPNGSAPHEVESVQTSFTPILAVLPNAFTTADAIANSGGASRATIKIWLSKALESGQIKMVQIGQGRRPTSYSKVNQG